ncbi:MAG: DUF4388 domain-containing protein [Deltaproteobacteria bacterium]|nr:DUF4388 domain-containing protein [Deltaproteobacteria bacterium]
MADRLFLDISPQGTLVAPTAQARAAVARRSGRWVLMPSASNMLLLSQWEGPEVAQKDEVERSLLMGEMGGIGLLDLLGLLSQTRRSVRIVVSRGRTERAILLRDGEIASVASSDAKDRLGEFLVRIGKLSAQQLQEALAGAQQQGRKLGQHLVQSALLSSHDLWSAIQMQIMEIICDVVSWTEGTYAIFSLPEPFVWPQTPPLPTQAIILEAVRRSDEMALFKHKIPTYDAVLSPTGKLPHDCEPPELAALQNLQPGMTVRELGIRLQKGEFDTTRVVYSLLKGGALSVTAAPAPAAPARAPAPAAGAPAAFPSPVTYGGPAGAGPIPAPAALGVPILPGAQELLGVFSQALREIDTECARHRVSEPYRRGLMAFLVDRQNAYSALFQGVSLRQDGDVDGSRLMANVAAANMKDPARGVLDAMNEMTFFALFQAAELLEAHVDEELARRVRQVLSVLPR